MVAAAGVLSMFAGSSVPAVDDERPNRMGIHGMVAIGNADMLLYHLALYHRPHDRQIVLPATLANSQLRADFRQWRAAYHGLVTIVPELFDLDRLDPASTDPIRRFSADVFEGHFERGGRLKFEAAVFLLEDALIHRVVAADAPGSVGYTYLTHAESAYLVKDIGARPGMDRILSLPVHPVLTSGERLGLEQDVGQGNGFLARRTDGSVLRLATDSVSEVYREVQDFR